MPPAMPAPAVILLPLVRHQEPKSSPDRPTERNDTGTAAPVPAGVPVAPNAQPEPCNAMSFGWLGLFVALMWFMVLRPESKRRKETASMLAALKQGDTVVTIGGMHGVVAAIQEKTVSLRVGNERMTFDRSAIARVLRDEPAKPEPNKS